MCIRDRAAGILVFFLASVVLLYFYPSSFPCPQCKDREFDSALWRNPPAEFTRVQMVNDLLKNHGLVGMTSDGIDALLGPGDGYEVRGCHYAALLGPERSIFALDPVCLCLRFENGRVADAEVVEG